MKLSCGGRVARARSYPSIGAGIISPACVQGPAEVIHPKRSFRWRSTLPCEAIGARAHCWSGRCPGISSGIVSPAGVQIAAEAFSTPDYHFVARPHCRVKLATRRRARGAGGRPTIRAGIVSSPGVQIIGEVSSRPRRSFQCQSRPRCDLLVPRARSSCPWLSKCPYSDCISHHCLKCHRYGHIHPRRSFQCRSRPPCAGIEHPARWWCWWPSNCPCWDCIFRRC